MNNKQHDSIPVDVLIKELRLKCKIARDNANTARLSNNHSVACVWSGREKECHELIKMIETYREELNRKWK